MGSKKKKNSNYVTQKTIKEKEDRERAKLNKKRNKIIIIVTSCVLAVLLTVGTVLTLGFTVFKWGEPPYKVTHYATMYIKDYDTPIHIELYGEEAPKTVENFVNLAEMNYYNGSTFHTVIKDAIIVGGKDPSEHGLGTPVIDGEFSKNGVNNRVKHERGVISMWRPLGEGYDSASDEFFIITNTKNAEKCDGFYAAFGRVIGGMEVIDKICSTVILLEDGEIISSNQPIIESISIRELE